MVWLGHEVESLTGGCLKENGKRKWRQHRPLSGRVFLGKKWKSCMGAIISYLFATADDPEGEMIDDRIYGGDLLDQFP